MRWAVAIIVILGALAGGWWLASFFQSSDQREANAAPPSPSPIVAVVSSGTLESERTFTGQVEATSQLPVTFKAPADATTAVVTGRPLEAGVLVGDGDVITEVNGRPVFVLSSPFAFYRTMGVGDSGPDVVALQTTLAHRGYLVDADGVFGARTEQAVRAWYGDAGYRVATRPTDTPEINSGPSGGDDTPDGATTAPQPAHPPADVAYVPESEMIALPSLPTFAVRGVAVGQPVAMDGTADVVLGSLERVVAVSAEPAQVAEIVEGEAATIDTGTQQVEATVSSIARASAVGTNAPDPGASPPVEAAADAATLFIITPATPLADVALGAQVRVVITRQVVPDESLLVPAIAVTDRGGANKVVLVRKSDGRFVEVAVTVLGTLDGQAAVAANQDGTLLTGDEVKVG